MPLLKGKSQIGQNVSKLVSEGRSRAQAIAIALRTAGVPKKHARRQYDAVSGPDYAAFHRAIVADPTELGHHRLLADHLDEHAQSNLGSWIRHALATHEQSGNAVLPFNVRNRLGAAEIQSARPDIYHAAQAGVHHAGHGLIVSPGVRGQVSIRAVPLLPPGQHQQVPHYHFEVSGAQAHGLADTMTEGGQDLHQRLGVIGFPKAIQAGQPRPARASRRKYATPHDPEAAFHAELDANPHNHDARHVLADWLDERGDPRGEAFTWLATRQKYPHNFAEAYGGRPTYTFHGPTMGRPLPHQLPADHPARLPDEVWRRTQDSPPLATRRAVEDDFARAFHDAKAAGWNPESVPPVSTVARHSRRAQLARLAKRKYAEPLSFAPGLLSSVSQSGSLHPPPNPVQRRLLNSAAPQPTIGVRQYAGALTPGGIPGGLKKGQTTTPPQPLPPTQNSVAGLRQYATARGMIRQRLAAIRARLASQTRSQPKIGRQGLVGRAIGAGAKLGESVGRQLIADDILNPFHPNNPLVTGGRQIASTLAHPSRIIRGVKEAIQDVPNQARQWWSANQSVSFPIVHPVPATSAAAKPSASSAATAVRHTPSLESHIWPGVRSRTTATPAPTTQPAAAKAPSSINFTIKKPGGGPSFGVRAHGGVADQIRGLKSGESLALPAERFLPKTMNAQAAQTWGAFQPGKTIKVNKKARLARVLARRQYQRRRYAAPHPDQIHPDLQGTRVARYLNHLATHDPDPAVSAGAHAALVNHPDSGAFHVLADSLEERDHPGAGFYNWRHVPAGVALDKKVHATLRTHYPRITPDTTSHLAVEARDLLDNSRGAGLFQRPQQVRRDLLAIGPSREVYKSLQRVGIHSNDQYLDRNAGWSGFQPEIESRDRTAISHPSEDELGRYYDHATRYRRRYASRGALRATIARMKGQRQLPPGEVGIEQPTIGRTPQGPPASWHVPVPATSPSQVNMEAKTVDPRLATFRTRPEDRDALVDEWDLPTGTRIGQRGVAADRAHRQTVRTLGQPLEPALPANIRVADWRTQVPPVRRYAEHDPEAPFHAAIDEAHVRGENGSAQRKVFADWLDEQGDPRAEPFRWLAETEKHPVHLRVATSPDRSRVGQSRWSWSRFNDTFERAGIPTLVHDRLHNEPDEFGLSTHPSRRVAEDDFARAFHDAKASGWNQEAHLPPKQGNMAREQRRSGTDSGPQPFVGWESAPSRRALIALLKQRRRMAREAGLPNHVYHGAGNGAGGTGDWVGPRSVTRYARLTDDTIHPDFRSGGIAAQFGAWLRTQQGQHACAVLTNGGSPSRLDPTHLRRYADHAERSGDTPLADSLRAAVKGIALDKLLHHEWRRLDRRRRLYHSPLQLPHRAKLRALRAARIALGGGRNGVTAADVEASAQRLLAMTAH